MKTVEGKYATAIIHSDDVEDYAVAQVKMICDNHVSKGSKIRVMPDVHPGLVGPIGLTMTIGDIIIPNLLGNDIGCGIQVIPIKTKKIEFQKLDTVIRENVPSGFEIRKTPIEDDTFIHLKYLCCYDAIPEEKVLRSMGTLGGGNHFIEVGEDDSGDKYLTVHSGSRILGKLVNDYYIKKGQKFNEENGIIEPYETTTIDGDLMSDYLNDVDIVKYFAVRNRTAIIQTLMKEMKWKKDLSRSVYCIDIPHNFSNDGVLRKGAISAHKDDIIAIPINMKDGVIIAEAKGNSEWNYSAPHGAGRILNRTDVKNSHTVSEYKKTMKGVYSSCIGKDTLDEAPFAYRGINEIQEAIKDTATVDFIIKPIYNFKAGSREDKK